VLPSTGIIHASQALDTIGLLTRRVADATALLLELIYHSTHHPAPAKLSLLRSLTPACTSLDLSSLRIGILSSLPAIHPAKLPVFNQLLSLLTASGAELVHNVHIPGLAVYAALSPAQKSIVLETHMQAAVNNYLYSLRTNPQNITSIEDLVAFTQTCPGEEFSRRNTVVLERAAASNQHRGMYDAMVELDKWFASDGGIPGALDRAGCDVLLCPALYVPLQTFASKAGVPVLSVPMGMFPPNTRIQQDEGSGMVDVAPGMP
jgi:amidase